MNTTTRLIFIFYLFFQIIKSFSYETNIKTHIDDNEKEVSNNNNNNNNNNNKLYSIGPWRKSLLNCWTESDCERVLTTAHGGSIDICIPHDFQKCVFF